MSVLDRLYSLEIEFHRLSRAEALDVAEASGIHTSYALQHGYEPLLRAAGRVDPPSLAKAMDRMREMGDPRDVRAAFLSLRQLFAVA